MRHVCKDIEESSLMMETNLLTTTYRRATLTNSNLKMVMKVAMAKTKEHITYAKDSMAARRQTAVDSEDEYWVGSPTNAWEVWLDKSDDTPILETFAIDFWISCSHRVICYLSASKTPTKISLT